MENFCQQGPSLENPFADGLILQALNHIAPKVFAESQNELKEFGKKIIHIYHPLSLRAEKNIPLHNIYSPWGERIDEIQMDPSWKKLLDLVAKDGIVAEGYEKNYNEHSRVYQMVKILALHPSSAFVTCPLAMTDGAAKALSLLGDDEDKKVVAHLTHRNPDVFWTSGQWMTEKTGGSDVSKSESYALENNNNYKIYGNKWFTSAVTSEVSLALAQHMRDGKSLGLSLFLIHLRDEKGRLQNIEVQRLKDKLGTKALPTAELHLKGVPAKLIGEPGRGVKAISSILNITRIYNSACSVGTFYRGLLLAKDYSQKREAFGQVLAKHPAHITTMIQLQVLFEANLYLLLFVAKLLGESETGKASPEKEAVLRLLTPILKLWTAKSCVSSISEILEGFGGAGYIEDTELPKLLRDSQVFSIWEGTTNVLSLDVLRVLSKPENLNSIFNFIIDVLEQLKINVEYSSALNIIFEQIQNLLRDGEKHGREYLEANSRLLSFKLARLFSGMELVKRYILSQSPKDKLICDLYFKESAVFNKEEITSSYGYLFNRSVE